MLIRTRLALTCLALTWLVAGLNGPVWAQSKLAFVAGINVYPNLSGEQQLQRAVNDADAVGDALESLGFSVTRVTRDATLDNLLRRFGQFTRTLKPGDSAVFFFAGHGITLDDGNYLIPADIPVLLPSDREIAKKRAVAERDIKRQIVNAGARVAIVVIDACRENPFAREGTRALGGTTRGLSRLEPTEGVFTLYSAREGQTALDHLSRDDDSRNSVFTRVFVEKLKQPGLSLSELGDEVRDEVATLAERDGHDQVPAFYNELRGARLVFLGGTAKPVPPNATPKPPEAPPPPRPQVEAAIKPSAAAPSALDCERPHGDYVTVKVAWDDPDKGLLIRAAPGNAAEVKGVIPPAATGLDVSNCQGEWCQVKYRCQSGWAGSRFLSTRANELHRVVGVGPNDPDGGLNLRTGPGSSFPKTSLIPFNADDVIVHVCQPATGPGSWCLVTYHDNSGLVAHRFLTR